jgi:hypothetical protein
MKKLLFNDMEKMLKYAGFGMNTLMHSFYWEAKSKGQLEAGFDDPESLETSLPPRVTQYWDPASV